MLRSTHTTNLVFPAPSSRYPLPCLAHQCLLGTGLIGVSNPINESRFTCVSLTDKRLSCLGKGNSIVGGTITLPSRQGDFLVAFLALYVHWSGTQFWGILTFALHQLRSTRAEKDGLHHQQQAVLRNGMTDANTLIWLVRLGYSWRKKVRHSNLRTVSVASVALFHILAFGAAGIFSSRVVRADDQVLIKPQLCGWYQAPSKAISEFNQTDWDAYSALMLAAQLREETKLAYTRSCYADESSAEAPSCDSFVLQRVDSTMNNSAVCPFSPQICELGGALEIDSGFLDSDLDLGINARPKDRVWYRMVTTWTLLNGTNFESSWTDLPGSLPGDKMRLYFLGPATSDGQVTTNFTFSYSNYSFYEYPAAYFLRYVNPTHKYPNLHKNSQFSNFPNAAVVNNDFQPVATLNVSDADVTILALNNYATYTGKVTDPLFEATTNVSNQILGLADTGESYVPNHVTTFLAAAVRHQFCHSKDFSSSCTPLRGVYQSDPDYYQPDYHNYSAFTLPQRLTVGALYETIPIASFLETMLCQGQFILSAHRYLSYGSAFHRLSVAIPSNQWQIEAQNLHNISLAGMQRLLVEHASPPVFEVRPGESSLQFLTQAIQSEGLQICASQKVRSTAYTSFSALGLSIILSIGSVIIFLNFCIVDVVFFVCIQIQRWRAKSTSWVDLNRLDWTNSQFLQLQSVVLEAQGVGPWKRGGQTIPVVERSESEFRIEDMKVMETPLSDVPHKSLLMEEYI
jgi:hypothetical protein